MSIRSRILGLPPALRVRVGRHQTLRARTASDRSLALRLRDGVRRSGAAVSGLAFYVHDGVVSVYGVAADAAARGVVVSLASGLPGVRRVVDHLQIGGA